MREGKIGIVQSPLQTALDSVAEDIVQTLGVDIALINLTTNTELVSLGIAGNFGRTRKDRLHVPSDLVCLRVIETNEALVLSDARTHTDFKFMRYVANGTVSGYLGTPIQNAEIGPIGAVCAISSAPRHWQTSDLRFLKTVGATVEHLILREIYRLESADASLLASEYDEIIAAFSLVRAEPTSIHDRDGRLVFANRALAEIVNESELETRDVVRMLQGLVTEEPVRLAIPRLRENFLVRRVETPTGYFVCHWTPEPDHVH